MAMTFRSYRSPTSVSDPVSSGGRIRTVGASLYDPNRDEEDELLAAGSKLGAEDTFDFGSGLQAGGNSLPDPGGLPDSDPITDPTNTGGATTTNPWQTSDMYGLGGAVTDVDPSLVDPGAEGAGYNGDWDGDGIPDDQDPDGTNIGYDEVPYEEELIDVNAPVTAEAGDSYGGGGGAGTSTAELPTADQSMAQPMEGDFPYDVSNAMLQRALGMLMGGTRDTQAEEAQINEMLQGQMGRGLGDLMAQLGGSGFGQSGAVGNLGQQVVSRLGQDANRQIMDLREGARQEQLQRLGLASQMTLGERRASNQEMINAALMSYLEGLGEGSAEGGGFLDSGLPFDEELIPEDLSNEELMESGGAAAGTYAEMMGYEMADSPEAGWVQVPGNLPNGDHIPGYALYTDTNGNNYLVPSWG